MSRYIYIFLCFFFTLTKLEAQQVKTFQKAIGFSGSDQGTSLLTTADGGFLMLGVTTSVGAGNADLLLTRTDSIGKVLWAKTYGGSGDEGYTEVYGNSVAVVADVQQTEDSSYLICSSTSSYGAGGKDVYLIKVDKSGNVIWNRTYGGTSDEMGHAVKPLANGGSIIVGHTKSYGQGNYDVFVIRTNDTGGVVWSKTYGNSNENGGLTITIDKDSNIIIGGHTHTSTKQYDYYVLKLRKDGSFAWNLAYGSSNYEVPSTVIVLPDKSIYLSGTAYTNGFGGGTDGDFHLMKFDSSGNLIWSEHYGSTSSDRGRQIKYNPFDTSINFTGWGFGFGLASPTSIYYLKTDTSGSVKWFRTYGKSGSSPFSNFMCGFGNILSFTGKAGVAMLGITNSFGAGNYDYYLIKTNDTGWIENCSSYIKSSTPSTKNQSHSSTSITTSSGNVSLSMNTGISVKSVSPTDTFLCEPFVAYFGWSNACAGFQTRFYDSTYINADKWLWTFNDTASTHTTDSLQNPTHTFKHAGTYSVKLKAWKGNSVDSITKTVTVYSPPAITTYGDTTICFGKTANLGVFATGTGLSYHWTPSHLVSDSTAAFPQAYPAATTNFIVYVTGIGGCVTTDTMKITVDTSASNCPGLVKGGGIINDYAQVYIVDTCLNALAVDTASFFSVGDKALLIQMQGATVDTSNNSGFGDIDKYNSAGKYEFIEVDSVGGGNVYAKHKFKNLYDDDGSVQLVRVPVYDDLYITSMLTASAWNGSKGGILAFEATGLVYQGADIDVSGKGFRGGLDIVTGNNNCSLSHKANYYYTSSSTDGAGKGEGIVNTKSSLSNGRGASANGGGGANGLASGGGGGGNYTKGGDGGKEWTFCSGSLSNGGVGGKGQLSGYDSSRIFLGGGGGGGHGVNTNAADGAPGGGIVIITAKSYSGNSSAIKSLGNSMSTTGVVKGGGGGGAGGTVLLNIDNWLDTVKVNASGGAGTKTNSSAASGCVGGGGGGAGGVVFIKPSSKPGLLVTTLKGGLYGTEIAFGKTSCGSNGATAGTDGVILYNLDLDQNKSTTSFTLPSGSASGPTHVCKNDSVQLSATGGVSYAWYPSTYFNDTTLASPKAKVDQKRTFYVRIYNAAGCYKLDSVVIDTIISQALSPPTLNCVTFLDDSTIKLTWTPYDKSDSAYFGYYVITSTAPGGSTHINSDTIYGRLTDTYLYRKSGSLTGGYIHFILYSVDKCGTRGNSSTGMLSLVLNSSVTDYTAKLDWNPNLGSSAAGVIIEANDGNGWYQIGSTSTSSILKYEWPNCEFDGKIRISYPGSNTNSCRSYSNEVKHKWQDTTPPAKPDIRYIYHFGNIGESYSYINAWVENEGTDVGGKAIISRSKNGGPWELVDTAKADSVLGPDNINLTFNDSASNKNIGDKFCYRLQGIDSCGNLSTVDEKCAPVLTVTPGNLRMTLYLNDMTGLPGVSTWNYYYFWRKKASDGSFSFLGASSSPIWVDSNVNCYDSYDYFGYTYHYVNSLYYGGYSNYVRDVSFDTIPPSTTVIRYATVASKTSNKVVFSQASDNYIKQYYIYGAKNGGSFSLLDSVASNNSSVYTYEHKSINPLSDTWCYYVKVEDSCTVNLSMPSDTHCVINLSATAGYTTVSLNWSKYMGDEVTKYKIQKRVNGAWATIDSVSSATTSYTDSGLLCGMNYDYRIMAAMMTSASYITFSDSVRVQTKSSTFSYTASGPKFICTDDSAQLYATGGTRYAWWPANLMNDTTLASPKGLVAKFTKFYVRIYDSTGCYVTDSVQVDTVNITKLKPPTLRCASIEGDSIVKVNWTPTNDTTFFGSYLLARTDPGGSSFIHEDTIYGGYNVSSYTYANEFRADSLPVKFRVYTINSCGSRGDPSSVRHTVVLSALVKDDKTVKLDWNEAEGFGASALVQGNEGSWIGLGTSSVKSFTYHSCGFDGKMRVYYEDSVTGCRSYSNAVDVKYKDVTPAPRPEMVVTSVTSSFHLAEVYFKNQADSTNVKTYYLLWSRPDGTLQGTTGKFEAGTKGPIIYSLFNYTLTDNPSTRQQCFSVFSMDSCGNYSDTAIRHCLAFLEGTAGNLENFLTWKPYIGFEVDSQKVQRKAGSNWKDIAKLNGSATSYKDSGLACNVGYTYRIISYRKGSSKTVYDSSTSNQLNLTPFDTIPPQPATIVHVDIASATSAWLTFTKSPSQDAYYYHLYSTTNDTGYKKIITLTKYDFTGGGQKQQIFTGLNTADNRYCFYVVVQDSCGENYSDSVGVCAPELSTTAGNQRVTLNWRPYEGADPVTMYLIKRSTDGVNFTVIDTVSGTDTLYTDLGLECNKKYTYRIDPRFPQPGTSGTIWFVVKSDTSSAIPFDTIPPAEVNLRYATVMSGSSIALNFDKVADADVNRYEVWRSDNGGAYQELTTLYRPLSSPVTYINTGLNTTTNTYCYKIYALDSCEDNISQTAEEHCVVQLSGTPGNNANHLSWSAYEGFGVGEYIIQRLDSSSIWSDLDTVNSSTLNYIDTLIQCNLQQHYRIKTKSDSQESIPGLVYYGDTHIDSSYKKFGGGSGLFDGLGDYLTIPDSSDFNFGTDNFTIDFWVWFNSTSSPQCVYSHSGGTTDNELNVIFHGNKFWLTVIDNGTPVVSFFSPFSINTGTWFHFEVVRSGNNWYIFKDGISQTLTLDYGSYNATLPDISGPVYMGRQGAGSPVDPAYMNGWIDELRVSKGIARHTSNFTPSTTSYIKDTYTKLLLHLDGADTSAQQVVSYSDSISLTPFDTIKPEAPLLHFATVNNRNIELSWARSSSPDVLNYVLYRKPASGGTWTTIDTVGDINTYTDSTVTVGAYCYYLQAMDSCAENLSMPTDTHCNVYLTNYTVGCEKSIYLDWTSYEGWGSVDKYELYRSVNGGTESLLATLGNTTYTYKDSLLDYHDEYCYRIKAYENGSSYVSWSNDSCNRTFFVDTPQMVKVSKIVTSSSVGELVVKWESQAGKPHLDYHRLYYRSGSSGAFSLLQDNIPLTNDSFVHTGINTRQGEHYYYILTVDSCGEISDSSSIHKSMDITVTVGQLLHNIHWTPYEGFDVKEYRVERLQGSVFVAVDTVPPTDTFNVQFPAPCNFNIQYRIAAVSQDDVIAWSDTMGRVAIDTVFANPAAMHQLTVVDDNQTYMSFTGSDSLDVYAYSIQRAKDGQWGTAGQVLFNAPSTAHDFIDTTNTLKEQLCYTIITLDSCLNATMSDTFCAIQLRGEPMNLSNFPHWSKFKGYPIDEYALLYYNTTTNQWDTLSKAGPNDTSYLHEPLQCNVPVSYRVAGHGVAYNTMSDTLVLVPYDTIRPAVPPVDFATVVNGTTITLNWQPSTSSDVRLYEIRYKAANSDWIIIDTLDRIYTYTFTGLSALDSTYNFGITAMDSCAYNRSNLSEIHTTIQLQGEPKNLSNLLDWSDYEGFGVEKYYVYKHDGVDWVLRDSTDGITTDYLDTGLQCNIPYFYRIEALSLDPFRSFSDSISLTPFDTIRPAVPPVDFATVVNGTTITLNWQPSTSSDVRLYEIRYKTTNGDWIIIDTLDRIYTYTFTGLNALDSTYSFGVTAMDSCAYNRSELSIIHSTIQLDGEPKNLSNLLAWSAYQGFTTDKYYIYRHDGTQWLKRDSVNGSTTNYLDTGLQCNIPYFYKIVSLSATAGFLSHSDSISLTPFDTIKPAAPPIDFATVDDGSTITLNWQPSSSDVKLYEIWYRNGNGSWQNTDTVELQYTYTFTGLNTVDSSYDFRLVAIDSCADNRSDFSELHRPIQLDGEPKNLSNLLTWAAYTGFDVKEYYVHRINGGNWEILDTVPGTQVNYTDTPLACNVVQYYKISALDATEQFISYSDSIELTPFDTILPPAPVMHYASVQSDGSIKLGWNWDPASDVKYYEVWRNEGLGSFSLINTVTYDSIYIDNGVQPQQNTYYYHLIAIDSCQSINRSAPSDTDRIMNLTLATGACEPVINLEWTAYEQFPQEVDEYRVYRSIDGFSFSLVHTAAAPNLKWDDDQVQEGTRYIYKIKAVDKETGFFSYSDTISLEPWVFPAPGTTSIIHATVDKTGITNGSTTIRWNTYDNLADTFARGYRLYHREGETGAYTMIYEEKDFSKTNFTHTGINTQTAQNYYYVKVFNLCDVEGDREEVHSPVNVTLNNQNLKIDISWTSYKGRTPMAYELYKKEDNGSFELYKYLPATDTFYTDTNVYCHKHYTYQVSSVLYVNNKHNSWSDTAGATAFDTIPPPAPKLHVVSVVATDDAVGEIAVYPSGSLIKNRSGFNIYRKAGNGSFSLYKTIDELVPNFVWDDLTAATSKLPYSYYFTAIDSCGNESMPSDTHTTVHLAATAMNHYIELKWTPYVGWPFNGVQYFVERRQDEAKPWTTIITLGADSLSYHDSDVTCHEFYQYRITARDVTFLSSHSNTDSDTAFEIDPPETSGIIRVTVNHTGLNDGIVQIDWEKSTSPDAAYYNLYRSEDKGNTWQLIAPQVQGISYLDMDLNTEERAYKYYILVEDFCGNINTQASTQHQTMILTASPGNEEVQLNWTPYEGWDVDRYEIIRDGGVFATVPGDSLSYINTQVSCVDLYDFVIRAVSAKNNNIISNSNHDSTRAYDHNKPAAGFIKLVTVTMPNDEVYLEWEPSWSFDERMYYLYKQSWETNRFELIDSTTKLDYTYKYKGGISGPDCFYLQAVDLCGNISEYSNRACIIYLKGRAEKGYNALEWNQYTDFWSGVKEYKVFRNEDSIGYLYLTTTLRPQLNDSNLTEWEANQYCYRVQAIENEGFLNATSFSTELCIYPAPIVYMPNTFTPQSDPDFLNDDFGPIGSYIKSYELKIYNRWGQLVHTTETSEPWDGTLNGSRVPEGVYMYQLRVKGFNNEEVHHKGTVTILR